MFIVTAMEILITALVLTVKTAANNPLTLPSFFFFQSMDWMQQAQSNVQKF
jgi:hypothetical protein